MKEKSEGVEKEYFGKNEKLDVLCFSCTCLFIYLMEDQVWNIYEIRIHLIYFFIMDNG